MTDSVVVEGYARLRDGKKWRTRWLVLRKPSPVADCLVLLVFKDKADRAQGNRERASVTLEEICGVEAGPWHDGVAFTLAVLCLNQAALLGFDGKEALQAWDARLRYSLGEVHRFSVGVLPGTKLESGPATLHLCNNLLTLARDVPPVIIGHWNLPDLRRYGPVANGFVFEGGSRCGYWAGVFLLASAESEQISFLFDCIVRGISPTRGPFGLRPVLPDPSGSRTHSEERLNHEAQELEKRLSMLSHRSSTASSSYCPSAGGDDRSISGSSDASDTSQSDGSVGSRAAVWSEPASSPSDGGHRHAAAKSASLTVEKLSVNQGGAERPAAKPPPRQLQEIGRQSSSDSGIATASHSSYSGSFSSCAGSLDTAPGGEDFGSALSLPPRLAHDLSPCTCAAAPRHEYRVPTSLRYLYDSPRGVLREGSGEAPDGSTGDPAQEGGERSDSETAERPGEHLHIPPPGEGRRGGSGPGQQQESCHTCKTIVTICSACGGFKTQCIPASGSAIPVIPDKRLNGKGERRRADPAYEIMESRPLERNSEAEEKSKYELMGSCGQKRLLQEDQAAAAASVLPPPPEAALPERPRGEGVTYVNIPVSPTSKKQLNYMELELQEPGPGPRGSAAHPPPQRRSSTKYAQIDITATETAHKVGAQHALGRQEGLHALEQRRKGTPH
ncbi:protein Dok-7-like isoform X3 [Pungitius pungitius]|uniref:protein Dok-7-like isoform X3 n=1 Tax=Pungitius pungitius TaxID=134920 RepID=UPI002E163180